MRFLPSLKISRYQHVYFLNFPGCEKHFWGSNCKNACTENCIGQQCYPGNGSCVWGCNAEHCLSDICDKNTAVCTNGCKERRTGRFCNMCKYDIIVMLFRKLKSM